MARRGGWVCVLGLLLTGCGGAASIGVLPVQPSATPESAAGRATSALPLLGNSPTVDVGPIGAYDLVAKGALGCWFGAGGPLKATHIFHADVPSPAAPGGLPSGPVEITIHERDPSLPSPRGTRAYQILLTPEAAERTRLTQQAGRLPADLASAMEADAVAWIHGKESCQARVVRPPPPPPPIVEKKQPKRPRRT